MSTSADSAPPPLVSHQLARGSCFPDLHDTQFAGPNQSRPSASVGDPTTLVEASGTSRPGPSHRSEAEWRQALADKDERIRELHHRTKNDLQLLSSLLSVQIRNIKDAEAARHLRDVQHRMHMLVRVHERLNAAQNGAETTIDVGNELKALCAELAQSLGTLDRNAAVAVELERCEVDSAKLVPLALSLNELVTNAIKHAAPPSPSSVPTRIVVSLKSDNGAGWAHLSVSDNGPGLPTDFDPTRCTGLGIRLVTSFVRQLGGRLSVACVVYSGGSAPRGACFTVSFPLGR